MRRIARASLASVLALCLWAPAARAQEEQAAPAPAAPRAGQRPVVRSVRVEGNARYTASQIAGAFGQLPGRALLGEAELRRGVEVLFATFHVRVTVEAVQLSDGSGAPVLGQEFDEVQQRLRDAARDLGEWIRDIDRLPQNDRAYMHDIGASPIQVRALFEAEGWSLERKRAAGQPPLHKQLHLIVRELQLFEERLQTPPNPYR